MLDLKIVCTQIFKDTKLQNYKQKKIEQWIRCENGRNRQHCKNVDFAL